MELIVGCPGQGFWMRTLEGTAVPYSVDAAEIDFMLAEQGQDVTVAGATVKGILDTTDLGLLAGEVTEVDAGLIVFTIKTGSLSGLAIGAALVSDGLNYRIRQWLRIGDGLLTQIFCEVA